MAAARNPNGPPLEPPWGVYIFIYIHIISLRAAFVPLAPRYNIYGPNIHILRHIPVYRPSGSGNQKRVGAARDLPAPRQRFIR